MSNEAPDFSTLLLCLSDRLPKFRAALLAQSDAGLEQVEMRPGEPLLRRGDTAHALYVVVDGLLRATAIREDGSELTLSEFGRGEMAGEMAILAGGGVYSASVSVVQDAVLVKIPRETLERIAKQAPDAIQEMSEGIRRRILRDQLAVGLTRLFGHLHETVLQYLEARVEWVRLRAGETLFTEGDKARDLYFILGGRLRAVARNGRVLSEMSRGESIGEIALLTGEPRTATVEAVRDSDLVRLSPEAFDEIVATYPEVMQVIARIVVQRLRARERTASRNGAKKCIAVLAAGPGVPPADFCERLEIGRAHV
jgi:CRP-like cAMP-binding protein